MRGAGAPILTSLILTSLILTSTAVSAALAGPAPAQAPVAAAPAPPVPAPHVNDPGKLPEPPPSVADLSYDARILSSAASAESFQGPLDGGWTLYAAGRGDVYGFELIDRRDRLEGAWRDLRRPGPAASGLLERVARTRTGVEIAFASPDGPTTLALRPDGANLRGELMQAGRRTPVVMRRAKQ